MIGTSYPLLDVFWTTLWIMGFFLWIWLAVLCFSDIFRSRDMGGFHKALWVIAIFVLPLLGVLIYLIARGHKMRDRAVADSEAQEQAFQEYVRQVTHTNGNRTDELAKLNELRTSGALTQEEFDREKARLMATSS